MMKAMFAGCIAALLTGAATAHAMTYKFVADACTGGCGASTNAPAGTVVTSLVSTGVVNVTVTLTTGTFHDTNDSQHHALAFDLVGTPTVNISNLPLGFTAHSPQSAGSVSSAGFGTFQYAINFPHANPPAFLTTFSFLMSGNGLGLNSFAPVGSNNIYFTTDIWAGPGQTGNTGNVGAQLVSDPGTSGGGSGASVPEPASWALLVAGFGLFGGASRLRRVAVG